MGDGAMWRKWFRLLLMPGVGEVGSGGPLEREGDTVTQEKLLLIFSI